MHFGVWRGFERLILFFRSYIFIATLNNRHFLRVPASYERRTGKIRDDKGGKNSPLYHSKY